MKKLLTIFFSLGLLTSMSLIAQDTMKQDASLAATWTLNPTPPAP
ncbi:MAG TPA: hypothetical protein VH350_01600 [Candidatus Sulfotelmatobacter sp.]|jgi:hypothetical protein|nr:hypothetical protein [Candidatus Sulfotelmatobacter sp.]